LAKYLATGAAGFIASKVCELLLGEGHQVVGLDNLNDAYDVRLKEWRLRQLAGRSGFTFHQGDICHGDGLRPIFQSGLDAVVNLAARAGVRQSVENPWVYFETNLTGTLNLLELCREFGVNKFILASTSSLYGANNPQPFREDANTDRPLSPYAASKKAAEVLCYTYHYLYGIDISVPRYFTVYGPRQRPDMACHRFISAILHERKIEIFGNGEQTRDFTYIDDVVEANLHAFLNGKEGGTYNIGGGSRVKLIESLNIIEEISGKKDILELSEKEAIQARLKAEAIIDPLTDYKALFTAAAKAQAEREGWELAGKDAASIKKKQDLLFQAGITKAFKGLTNLEAKAAWENLTDFVPF